MAHEVSDLDGRSNCHNTVRRPACCEATVQEFPRGKSLDDGEQRDDWHGQKNKASGNTGMQCESDERHDGQQPSGPIHDATILFSARRNETSVVRPGKCQSQQPCRDKRDRQD